MVLILKAMVESRKLAGGNQPGFPEAMAGS